uniref:(northern house mosquito) hypothetical protein n=1 Tax=Culex pipiens TaxID=7175 RepID=A0A8D8AQF5_CULPI
MNLFSYFDYDDFANFELIYTLSKLSFFNTCILLFTMFSVLAFRQQRISIYFFFLLFVRRITILFFVHFHSTECGHSPQAPDMCECVSLCSTMCMCVCSSVSLSAF